MSENPVKMDVHAILAVASQCRCNVKHYYDPYVMCDNIWSECSI